MDTGTLFNKVWIVESLRPGDKDTGKSLYNDVLLPIASSYPDLKIGIACPIDRASFFEALNNIRKECVSGTYPILHFECHGNKYGFQLSNSDVITWNELRNSLIAINEASKLNTVIVVAACNGIYLLNVSMQLDKSPFWAVIGPTEEVSDLEIKRDFASFYRVFFQSLDGDKAIFALNRGLKGKNRPYHFVTCIGLFKRAYINYHKKYCRGKGKQTRIEELVTKAMNEPRLEALGVNEIRRRIKSELAQEQYHFNKKRREFFLINLYPENAARFPISYDEIVTSIPS